MYIDIKQVCAGTIINDYEISRIPKEKFNEIIRYRLAHEIAQFIIKNMDELPSNYKKESDHNSNFYSERHTVRFNIISDEEILRLQQIEREYYVLTNYPGPFIRK